MLRGHSIQTEEVQVLETSAAFPSTGSDTDHYIDSNHPVDYNHVNTPVKNNIEQNYINDDGILETSFDYIENINDIDDPLSNDPLEEETALNEESLFINSAAVYHRKHKQSIEQGESSTGCCNNNEGKEQNGKSCFNFFLKMVTRYLEGLN